MNFKMPTIPPELIPANLPSDWIYCTEQLWTQVTVELTDPKYKNLKHYGRYAYDKGCIGPMCTKFARDVSRSRPRSGTNYKPREERIYDPIIDYFRIIALKQLEDMRLTQNGVK